MSIEEIEKILETKNLSKLIKKKSINFDSDLIGKKFNKLTVICDTGYRNTRRKPILLCICECGNYTLQTRDGLTRTDGKATKSCGCLLEKTWKSSRIMAIFRNMKSRTGDPKHKSYESYGAVGKTICKEWLENPKLFYDWSIANGYDDTKTIDRINNDLGYSPDNCRWTDEEHQQNNKRQTVRIKGIPLLEFENVMNIRHLHSKIKDRLKNNWDYLHVFQEYFLNKFELNNFYIDKNIIKINNEIFKIEDYCQKYNITQIALQTRVKRHKKDKIIIKEYILENSKLMCVEIIESVLQNSK